MKKWISRLIGSADSTTHTPADLAPTGQPAADAQLAGIGDEIDAAYYRWLTASAGFHATAELEAQILALVTDFAGREHDAAALVPRMPEVIAQLLRSLDDDAISASVLSRQVEQDVVLVAEVIREANSAYHRTVTPVKTVEGAVMMLGQNGLRMLLARLAFRPIIKMQESGFSRRVAPQVWAQSEKCALAASLVAPGLAASVFEAYLAGLMQSVGLIVAFRLADRLCPDGGVPASSEFGLQLLAAGRQLSAGIARHWEFPAEVIEAIAGIAGVADDAPSSLAQALVQGDRIAKLGLLLDAGVLPEDDSLIMDGLGSFERRCLKKMRFVES